MKKFVLFFVVTICFCGLIRAQNNLFKELDSKINSIGKIIKENERTIESLKYQNDSLLRLQSELVKEKNNITLQSGEGEIYVAERNTFIYETNKRLKTIAQIPEGAQVMVTEEISDSYRVKYNDTEGWVSKYFFKSSDKIKQEEEIAKQKIVLAEKQGKEKEELAEKQEKEQLALLTTKYGSDKASKILVGKIWIGMTKEMLIDSRGYPSDINRSVGSYGVHEQWVYEDSVYIYLENGVLTSWQD